MLTISNWSVEKKLFFSRSQGCAIVNRANNPLLVAGPLQAHRSYAHTKVLAALEK